MSRPVVLKVGGIAPKGAILKGRGAKKLKGVVGGQNNTKGENNTKEGKTTQTL